ncbi:MAG: hypothetical protein A2W90_18680 [Bacteroidetes bacterium GWF2_42_66]|nr:MAG: hypothetical protein A2W92_05485 [Bacteroidetes bacterium GWA2_42_15]OFX98798.1 MAG: hypothetical protein A2W89_11015 [Bacteroidetes bacterium GWE2_42_39]OFY43005.1 MAG: hypothetical protein A2W90_18680 [Bacteroidetes bacterium GWF2_42_66]
MRNRLLLIIYSLILGMSSYAQDPVFELKPTGRDNQKFDGYRGIWFELNQKYEYGDKYSGGLGTYTTNHLPLAIYAKEADKTFFVYGGTTDSTEKYLLCMIGCYDHKTHKVSQPTIVCDKMGVKDPHDNPVIQIDDKGYIWVFVNGRGRARPGFKYRSINPYDIEKFEQITMEEMAYPQPWYIEGKGFLNLFTKYTGVRLLYFETSTDGFNWSDDHPLAAILEPGDTKGGHYQISTRNGNTVGTFFNRHPDGNVDKRTDLYYIETSDLGKTWTSVEDNPLNIPIIEVENPARVINYQEQGLNVYLCDMGFDKDGHPVCLYVTSRGHEPGPKNSPYQWKLTRWTGSDWVTSAVGDSDHNYDAGSLYLLDDKWLVVAPLVNGPQLWGAGGELAFYESADEGKTWKKIKQITNNSPRNHTYVRRPINAQDPFLYFWADGNPDKFSISKLYFGDSSGHVWQLPYEMKGKMAKPIKVVFPPENN